MIPFNLSLKQNNATIKNEEYFRNFGRVFSVIRSSIWITTAEIHWYGNIRIDQSTGANRTQHTNWWAPVSVESSQVLIVNQFQTNSAGTESMMSTLFVIILTSIINLDCIKKNSNKFEICDILT